MSAFPLDSKLAKRIVRSPNVSERRQGARTDILLLHYTGMQSAQAALERLCDPVAKVSSHYMVFEDGEIVQMVPEKLRAHHAGVSYWAGDTDINSRSIGIEIANPGHDYGYPDFPARQMSAVIELCRDIIARNLVPADFVLAHSDIAPTRKQDPGEKFPWEQFARSGVGLWVKPTPIDGDAKPMKEGEHSSALAALQKDLAEYGYGVPQGGTYDELSKAVIVAFQRHFRPARIDGLPDASTRETLKALLAARTRFA